MFLSSSLSALLSWVPALKPGLLSGASTCDAFLPLPPISSSQLASCGKPSLTLNPPNSLLPTHCLVPSSGFQQLQTEPLDQRLVPDYRTVPLLGSTGPATLGVGQGPEALSVEPAQAQGD